MPDVRYKQRRCPHCHGKGYIKGQRCGICNGRGYIVDSETYIDTPEHKKIYHIPNPLKKRE